MIFFMTVEPGRGRSQNMLPATNVFDSVTGVAIPIAVVLQLPRSLRTRQAAGALASKGLLTPWRFRSMFSRYSGSCEASVLHLIPDHGKPVSDTGLRWVQIELSTGLRHSGLALGSPQEQRLLAAGCPALDLVYDHLADGMH